MNLEATTQLTKGSKYELNVNVLSAESMLWLAGYFPHFLPVSCLFIIFFLRNFPQDQNEKNTEVVIEVANIKPLD